MNPRGATTNTFRDLLSSALADVLQPAHRPPEQPQDEAPAVELHHEGTARGEPAAEEQQAEPASPDPYAVRVEHIKQKYAADAAAAAEARRQLQEAQQQAQQKELDTLAAADAAYTPAWRQTGLPAKASQLSMDPSWLSGTQLLDPAAVMAKQRTQQQKEVMQPPTMFEYTNKEADPHYLQETNNLKVRQTITQQRIAASRSRHMQSPQQPKAPQPAANLSTTSSSPSPKRLRGTSPAGQLPTATNSSSTSNSPGKSRAGLRSTPWSELPAEEVSSRMAAAAARYKAMAAIMTPEQREVEEQIIKSMYHRLSFLRNPRYPTPQAATAMQHALKGTHKGHKQKQQKRSSPDRSNSPGATGLYTSPVETGLRVTPAKGVLFDAYEPGGAYFQTVQLQNVSNVMKGLRLLPPASRYFQISLPRFPSAANDLAPGMNTELSVCFTPDSLGDYEDSFTVETWAGRFEVALRGSRPHLELTLPDVLQVGDVLVGNSRSRNVNFTNKGGDGRYLLLPAHEWAAAAQQHQQYDQQQLELLATAHIKPPNSTAAKGPDHLNKTAATAAANAGLDVAAAAAVAVSSAFSISPTFLDLPGGSGGSFTVQFTPGGPGFDQGDFVLVCDNCTVRQLSIQGYGSEVRCELVELDGRELHEGETEAPIWFGQVHPGCCCSRTMKIHNATKLQFPFKWQVDQLYSQQQQRQQPAFAVYPSSGVISPNSAVDFVINYAPPGVSEHAAAAVLLVERSGDALLRTINTASAGSSSSSSSSSKLTDSTSSTNHTISKSKLGMTAGADPQQQQQDQQSSWEAVVHLGFEGRGISIVLQAEPAAVMTLPGQITVGEVGEQQLVLQNPTAAPAHIQISTDQDPQHKTTSSSSSRMHSASGKTQPSLGPNEPDPEESAAAAAAVLVDPQTATIEPRSSLQVSVKFLALAAGIHSGSLIVNIQHGQCMQVATKAYVQAACAVPAVPQIDFGILCIGHQNMQLLELVNTAVACKTDWAIEQLNIQATCPRMELQCDPSSGTLDASASCTTAVTVTGSCEGTHRLLLRVSSSSLSGQQRRQLTQHQYVEVLVTVAVPKVVLDVYRIHLKSAYLGVEQQRTVTLTNISRLPVQFSWAVQQLVQQQQHSSRSNTQQHNSLPGAADPSSGGINEAFSAQQQEPQQQTSGRLRLSITPAKGCLAPGQQQHLHLTLEPLAVGPVQLVCCCNVPGMTALAGIAVTALIEGLQVAYAVERPVQQSLAATISSMTATSKQQIWQRQQQGLEAVNDRQQQQHHAFVLIADFGVVMLHQVAELLLRVTNQTSIDTNVRAWLSRFPAAAADGSSSSLGQLGASTVMLDTHVGCSSPALLGGIPKPLCNTLPGSPAAAAAPATAAAGSGATAVRAVQSVHGSISQQSASRTASPNQYRRTGSPAQTASPARTGSPSQQQQQQFGLASRLAQTISGTGKPGFVSAATGQLQGPFRAGAGNAMMAARLVAAAAAAALGGGCAGCAVVVEPGGAELMGWGDVEMRLMAYNNLPGTYIDCLNVQVGDLPVRRIPLRLQVTGSPLVISRDRVLVQGLQQLQQQQQQSRTASPLVGSRSNSPAVNDATGADQPVAAAVAAAGSSGVGDSTSMDIGLGVVPAGVLYERTFYVFNTGALPMRLVWEYQAPIDPAAAAATNSNEADGATADPDVAASQSDGSPLTAAATAAEPAGVDAEMQQGELAAAAAGKTRAGNGGKAGQQSSAAAAAAAAAGSIKRPGSGSKTAAKDLAAAAAAAGDKAKAAAGGAAAKRASTAAAAAAAAQDPQQQQQPDTTADAAGAPVDPNTGSEALVQAADSADAAAVATADSAADSLLPEGGPSSLLKTLQAMSQQRKQQQQQQQQQGLAAAVAAVDTAFGVEPLECTILPQKHQKFTVRFISDEPEVHSVKLVGRQQFVQQGEAATSVPELQMSLWPTQGSAAADAAPYEVILSGGFHAHAAPPPTPMPALSISLSATTVTPQLTPDDPDTLNWTVWSTHNPASHGSYKHVITLCNTSGCPLVFQLAAEGPFELSAAAPSVPQDPDAYRGLKGAATFSQSIKQPGSSGSRLPSDTLLLPPGESVDAAVMLKPPAVALQAPELLPAVAAAAAGSGQAAAAAAAEDAAAAAAAVRDSEVELAGALVVAAASGLQQRVPLSALVLHPIVTASPAKLSFGSVHLSAPRTMVLLLTNPTRVDADWHVEVVPVPQQSQQQPVQQQQQQPHKRESMAGSSLSTARSAAASTFRGSTAATSTTAAAATGTAHSLFMVKPESGVLQGRGLGMPKTQRIGVTFAPVGNLAAAAELRILVSGGSGCSIQLEGQGTFEETSEHLAVLKDW